MEREVGGGIGMGNTCKPMAVSFQCMTKFTTKKKKKKKKQTFISVGEILQCIYSPNLWVIHSYGMGFDYIACVPLLPSCSFSFVFGCRIPSSLLINVCLL